MRVTIHGAGGGEVTGSAYLVQTREANLFVDMGMFQGGRKAENLNFLPQAGAFDKLDAVILTHGEERGRRPLGKLISERFNIHETIEI